MIRLCESADKQKWIELNKLFMEYEYKEENIWEAPISLEKVANDFDLILTEGMSTTKLFFIEDEKVIIGFMTVQCFYSVWAHGKVFFIDDFFLIESYRGKGIGTAAINELEEYAKNNGIVRLQLMAENTNPKAINFYKKINYGQQKLNFFCKYL